MVLSLPPLTGVRAVALSRHASYKISNLAIPFIRSSQWLRRTWIVSARARC
jgi:hypothetical protein